MEWTTALILNLILALHQVFWGLLVYYMIYSMPLMLLYYSYGTVQLQIYV